MKQTAITNGADMTTNDALTAFYRSRAKHHAEHREENRKERAVRRLSAQLEHEKQYRAPPKVSLPQFRCTACDDDVRGIPAQAAAGGAKAAG